MRTPTLAERLAKAMNHAGLNQKQLEVAAGLSKGYMSRPLAGKRERLSPETLHRIADVCSVGYEWLAAGQGEMLPGKGEAVRPAPAVVVPEGPGTVASAGREEPVNPFEHALAEAFKRGDFELRDLDAIRGLLRNGASLLRDESDLVDAATSWLRAASALRRDGRPVAIETLAYRMATLGSVRSERALEERSDALNAEAREELRRLGAEPPEEPVLPQKRRSS